MLSPSLSARSLIGHQVAGLVDQRELVAPATLIPVLAHHVGIRAIGDQALADEEEYAVAGLVRPAPDASIVPLYLDRLAAAAAPEAGQIGLMVPVGRCAGTGRWASAVGRLPGAVLLRAIRAIRVGEAGRPG